MPLNSNNINDLKESFDHLLKRNNEVQDDVKIALRSEDYTKAIKVIDNYVKLVDSFIQSALNLAQNYNNKANYENHLICVKAEKMAEEIKTAHLEVEKNILKKYRKKD